MLPNMLFHKLLIICAVFMKLVLSNDYAIPVPTLEILQPKGLRVSIPDEPGINLVGFHGSINDALRGQQEGQFYGDMRRSSDGKWIYENKQKRIRPTDTLNYWMFVLRNGVQYRVIDKSLRVNGDTSTIEVTTLQPPPPTPTVTDKIVTVSPTCTLSKTLVKGQRVCQGELVFEDNFNSLDLNKWKKDIRVPSDLNDADFVSFQSRPENCYVNDGQLYIVPNLLSEVPGYNSQLIRNGRLNLGSECTAIVDTESECKREAGLFRILPPVISAKLRTKDSFSFLYGKIEVRAKLPKGDWLFPQIVLEPLTNNYGVNGYASGQMRVAFIRGNEILETFDNNQIDGKRLYGGVVLATGDRLRDVWLKSTVGNSHFGSDFHTYSLVWTEDAITLAVDGNTYANIPGGFKNTFRTHNISHAQQWENGDNMAPFDKEFYIALGVSAGGVSDFPDGCRSGSDHRLKPWTNISPKAELKFWQDRNNWYGTWGGVKAGMQVDYVRVWAL